MSGIDDDRPQEVGRLLEGLFRKRCREPALVVNRLRQAWPAIVGEALARVTWPARIARGVLWINAIDTGWAFNLQFVKADLLNAVQTFLGSQQIREIRYKAGPLPAREAVAQGGTEVGTAGGPSATEAAAPAARIAPADPAAASSARAAPAPDSAASGTAPSLAATEAVPSAPQIADPRLRERFLRLAAKLKSRRKGIPAAASPGVKESAGGDEAGR